MGQTRTAKQGKGHKTQGDGGKHKAQEYEHQGAGGKRQEQGGDAGQDQERDEVAEMDPPTHRRILDFINRAVRPKDLVYEKEVILDDHAPRHEAHGHGKEQILDPEAAEQLIAYRDKHFPLGFRNIREVQDAKVLDLDDLNDLYARFSRRLFGRWTTFEQPIPRRGPGGYDGIIHAAMLRTGKVLFITADETTLLWDPDDPSPSTFADPVNQPHEMPGGYSQLCGHHVFLSDGQLLSVGGGGYSHSPSAKWGYRFDPASNEWARTAGAMTEARWYPTAVTLGHEPGRVLVACGHGHGQIDIYDENTDTFTPLASGDAKPFPELYPGMHLLPNGVIFYSRTGWASPGPGKGPYAGASDDQSAFFSLTGSQQGVWNDIAPSSPSMPDRTKGMSVMLLSKKPPYVRVMALGGADPANNHTYEVIDVTALSPSTQWGPALAFPDGEHRSLPSAVLLPDGNVFVCGGIQRTNSPCTMYDPEIDSWRPMAALPSQRDYHSAALLLPSGQVMMAGWNNTEIEIYSPPYLFRGPRPKITSSPDLVHHGQDFTIKSPQADSVDRVVLVRPMAVTHQTDSEQKVIELDCPHRDGKGKELTLRMPDGGHPHSIAQRGYYMMFAIDETGVPSKAEWIYLH